jgi:cyclase
VLGHERCREEVLASGTISELVFPGVDWGEVQVRAPFVTFTEQLTVWIDDLRVELLFVGPAHTTNDVVAWVPERRTLGPQTIVPGHGAVCGPDALASQRAYLRMVSDVADGAAAAGAEPLEAAREADLGEFAAWHDPERLVGNLHRALAERRGLEPGGTLDVAAAFADMVAYNGGRPLRCLA